MSVDCRLSVQCHLGYRSYHVGPVPHRSITTSVVGLMARLSVCRLSLQYHVGSMACRLNVGYRSSAISVIGPVSCRLSVQYHVGSMACRVMMPWLSVCRLSLQYHVGCRSNSMSMLPMPFNRYSAVHVGCRSNAISAQCHIGSLSCRLSVRTIYVIHRRLPRLSVSVVGPAPCNLTIYAMSVVCSMPCRSSVQSHVG